jgi:hypothetical protein
MKAKTIIITGAVLTAIGFAAVSCSTGTTTASAPVPQGTVASAPAAPAAVEPAPAPAPAAAAPAPAPAAVSTCDAANEAILTGSPEQITAALKALTADKTAPATAREYAQYFVVRDAGQKDLQSMDTTLITAVCTG